MVKINVFKDINDARKLACFPDVTPFENRSRASIFGKYRVSLFVDKELITYG